MTRRESPEGQGAPTILDRIVATKRREVRLLEPSAPDLVRAAGRAPPTRDMEAALRDGNHVTVIAEVKRRSPGAGDIRVEMDPALQASRYEKGGASAVSVLTDRTYFSGSLEDLSDIRQRVSLPILRKDFVIDGLQLLEARAAGADAVLLIVRILEDETLARLHTMARELGMSVLVEAHDREEVTRALAAGARIVGINNRDLRTFGTDLRVTLGLVDRVPHDVLLISESGVGGPDDVALLGAAGVDSVLVGEWLVRQADPTQAVASLARHARRARPAC